MKRLADRDPRVLAILLASLHDYTPGPAVDRRNPLSVRQPAASSWAPSGYELCPDCDLDGTVKRGKHRVICPRCKGKGCWPVDGYDTSAKPLQVLNGDADVGKAARQLCDLTLPELDRAVARLEAAADKDEDALWVALQRQARFTGQPWARQLVEAGRMLPPQYRLALRLGLLEQIGSPADPMLVEVGLAMLGEYLPVSFRAPRFVVDAASAEAEAEERAAKPTPDRAGRDAMIRAMNENGRSLRQIGAKVGMSQEGVRRVLQRQEREAA